MSYRDAQGHFCSRAEAEAQGTIPGAQAQGEGGATEPEEDEAAEREPATFGEAVRQTEAVFVDTGRGHAVEVPAGSPFVATTERLAEEAHYGGYFRVFLNGREVVNPQDSPDTIEPGMRVLITSYDKVGA